MNSNPVVIPIFAISVSSKSGSDESSFQITFFFLRAIMTTRKRRKNYISECPHPQNPSSVLGPMYGIVGQNQFPLYLSDKKDCMKDLSNKLMIRQILSDKILKTPRKLSRLLPRKNIESKNCQTNTPNSILFCPTSFLSKLFGNGSIGD
jgi:hypothetical protein